MDVSIDLTDVTLVSDDTNRRLYWCDHDDPDGHDDPDDPDNPDDLDDLDDHDDHDDPDDHDDHNDQDDHDDHGDHDDDDDINDDDGHDDIYIPRVQRQGQEWEGEEVDRPEVRPKAWFNATWLSAKSR